MGTASPITVARRRMVQSGAFALSPGSVQLVYTPITGPGGPTYTLAAGPGTFDLASGTAILQAHRRLSAAGGVFGWAGAAIALLVGRRFPAAVGAFDMHGAVAVLRAVRHIPADTGVFSLFGTDAQLRYSAQIDYARAPVGTGYAPRQHYNEGRPAATSSARPAATQRNCR